MRTQWFCPKWDQEKIVVRRCGFGSGVLDGIFWRGNACPCCELLLDCWSRVWRSAKVKSFSCLPVVFKELKKSRWKGSSSPSSGFDSNMSLLLRFYLLALRFTSTTSRMLLATLRRSPVALQISEQKRVGPKSTRSSSCKQLTMFRCCWISERSGEFPECTPLCNYVRYCIL